MPNNDQNRSKLGTDPNVVHVLRTTPSRWDRQIVADLIAEMKENISGERQTVPEMRTALAIAGYKGLQSRIENAVNGKNGTDALRAMAHAMRSFALGSPGLAAASFRNPILDSPEWSEAGKDLADTVFRVFADLKIEGDDAQHAVRILRSMIRGFILNEMVSASAHPLEFQKSYVIAIEMYIKGLSVFGKDH